MLAVIPAGPDYLFRPVVPGCNIPITMVTKILGELWVCHRIGCSVAPSRAVRDAAGDPTQPCGP